jgi:hypothetical protein
MHGHQPGTGRQQRPDEVAVEALDLHLAVPAGAHDLREPFGIIGIRLVEPQR